MATRITTDQLWTILREQGNRFFSVTFERRTSRKDGTADAGALRTMLCRTGMNAYKKGVIPDQVRDAEDFRNGIITVWSVDVFRRNVKELGLDKEQAAWNAWRRIDVITVRECSLLEDAELPPEFVEGAHQITNEYRLSHLPR